MTEGPQSEFYLPEPSLQRGNPRNVLTLLLAYTETASVIRTLRVEPYPHCSVRCTRLEFEWEGEISLHLLVAWMLGYQLPHLIIPGISVPSICVACASYNCWFRIGGKPAFKLASTC